MAGLHPIDASRTKVIACATVIEDLAPLLPPGVRVEVLDFGLHVRPGRLTEALQAAIDATADCDVILLGYGLCSGGVVGVRATTATLVIPRVDDCIAIFLGSRTAYREEAQREPGTYYVTKGWLAVGDTPLSEYERVAARYGVEAADHVLEAMFHNYTRLAFIDTGPRDRERYRAEARRLAARLGLRYEELAGSPALVEKLLFGPWGEECVVISRGQTVSAASFLDSGETASRPGGSGAAAPDPGEGA